MSNRILVTYSTWAGSSQGVAEMMGQTLREMGAEVDVQPSAKVKTLKGYQGAVVGGAARMGKLHGDTPALVRRVRKELASLPIAMYVVCLTMKDDTPENRATVETYFKPLREQVFELKPVSTGLFAGAYDPDKLTGVIKFIMARAELPKGDFRNWDAIIAWTHNLQQAFNL